MKLDLKRVIVVSSFLCLTISYTRLCFGQTNLVTLHPEKSLHEVVQKAGSTKRTALVYLTAKWCGPCKVLEEEIFADTAMASLLNQKYYLVKWDIDSLQEAKTLKKKYLTAVPSLFAFKPNGDLQYFFVGYTNRKTFAKDMEYTGQPELDPLYKMTKRYAQQENITPAFLLTYAWALQNKHQTEDSRAVFAQLWRGLSTKEKLRDGVLFYLTRNADPLAKPYRDFIKSNLPEVSKVLSKNQLIAYITGPDQYQLDEMTSRNIDSAGFDVALARLRAGLLQLSADSTQILDAGLYPLRLQLAYHQPNGFTLLQQKTQESTTVSPELQYYYFTILFSMYNAKAFADLQLHKTQLLEWLQAAAQRNNKYLYSYFQAQLYLQLKDKTRATRYANAALNLAAQEFPGKKPMAVLALQAQIDALAD